MLPTLTRAASCRLAVSMMDTSLLRTLLTQQYLPSGLNVTQFGPLPTPTLPTIFLLAVSKTYMVSVPQLVTQSSFASGDNSRPCVGVLGTGNLTPAGNAGSSILSMTFFFATSAMTKPCRSDRAQ